jgi:transposase
VQLSVTLKEEPPMNEIITIGLDLAKTVFQVHGVDATGAAVLRRRLRRSEVLKFFARLEPCLVGMEACAGAHYWARELSALGHAVKLMPPAYVKPYVKRGKSNVADAAAICEAVTRPSMRFVPVKSTQAQAMRSLDKVRATLVGQRTQTTNTLRSLLAEFGVIAPQGAAARLALGELVSAAAGLAEQIKRLETEILAHNRTSELSRRLATVPGVGPITAFALIANVPDATAFRSGRHFAAWVGLTPRQHSSGGQERLGHISKMGNQDLRRLFVLGATSILRRAAKHQTPQGQWLRTLLARKPARLVTVALANKLARIVWALMARGGVYRAAAA